MNLYSYEASQCLRFKENTEAGLGLEFGVDDDDMWLELSCEFHNQLCLKIVTKGIILWIFLEKYVASRIKVLSG